MSDDRNAGLFQFSAPVRLCFQHLFTPRKFKDKRTGKETGEAKFDAMFFFEPSHADFAAIRTLVSALAEAKFPTQFETYVKGDKRALQLPWKLGDALADEAKTKNPPRDNEFLRGHVCITARSQFAPFLSAILDGRVVDFKDDARPSAEKFFYNGVGAIVELNFVPHEVGSNTPGVTAYLNHVLSTNKGDRIVGGADTAEKFSGYMGTMTAEDPTAGLSNEIPF